MDERHAVGETEADSAGAGLLGEERADVHARACESQITVHVQSISPEPLARSSTRVPGGRGVPVRGWRICRGSAGCGCGGCSHGS